MKLYYPLYIFYFLYFAGLFLPSSLQAQRDSLSFPYETLPISEANIFSTEGYYNWGASIIKGEDGQFHLFYSRWKKAYSFYGWLTHSEVAHATSDHPSGPWTYRETALKGRGMGHWDAITAHNPKIKYFNGKYYLYYISTHLDTDDYSEADLLETARTGYSHPNWAILRPNQRTGVAISSSLSGPWERLDSPIIEPSGPITTLTVNPAITQGHDGRYYLIVKGDKPNETRFIRNQAMSISDTPIGPFSIQEAPVIDYMDTEDMSIWFDTQTHQYYGVFHAHQYIGIISSADGIKWDQSPPIKLMGKIVPKQDGDNIHPDRLERPFIYVEDNKALVLSLAVKRGDDSFTIFVPLGGK